jgi:hypothetical protein
MIYIKRLNFCYIRVPKSASSTVMTFLYNNVCDVREDVISRAFEWDDTHYEKVYHVNCPILPHSHVDATYVIDNNIVPSNAIFKGVVRHPFERQLSLYFYRIRTGIYGHKKPSIQEFRSKIIEGVLQDKPQQMQSQSSFLQYKGKTVGDYWLCDNIDKHLYDFCELQSIPIKVPLKNINVSPGNKKELVDIFYTPELKTQVRNKYYEDFELYERLKDLHRL